MLPIGIVIPTRNNAAMLRGDAGSLRSIVEHAAEAVVVDSSEDGTLELLQEMLGGLNVRFLKQPPGLYQCWNHAIAQLAAPYAYISTAGDSIKRGGLEHLFQTAEALDADVVASPPEFKDGEGRTVPGKLWPIHDLVARGAIREPILLDRWTAFLLQVMDAPQSLMGSSAANLYRTATLQTHPFSADYGHFGDVAWGIQNALTTRFAVTPSVVSSFYLHEGGAVRVSEIEDVRARLHALAKQVLEGQNASPKQPAWIPDLRMLFDETAQAWGLQQDYDELRAGTVPWWLRPAAWRARSQRKNQKSRIARLKKRLLDTIHNGNDPFRT